MERWAGKPEFLVLNVPPHGYLPQELSRVFQRSHPPSPNKFAPEAAKLGEEKTGGGPKWVRPKARSTGLYCSSFQGAGGINFCHWAKKLKTELE